MKSADNLKFIPTNLHLENFLVERIDVQESTSSLEAGSSQTNTEKSCYAFTSVGAFTTFHTNKPNYKKTLDQLMILDRGFKFEKNGYLNSIDNELVLNFYSLKLLIQLGDTIHDLSQHTGDRTQVNHF